eukprot:175756_1
MEVQQKRLEEKAAVYENILSVGKLCAVKQQVEGNRSCYILAEILEIKKTYALLKDIDPASTNNVSSYPWTDIFLLIPFSDTSKYHKRAPPTILAAGMHVLSLWKNPSGSYTLAYYPASLAGASKDPSKVLVTQENRETQMLSVRAQVTGYEVPSVIRSVCASESIPLKTILKLFRSRAKIQKLKLSELQAAQQYASTTNSQSQLQPPPLESISHGSQQLSIPSTSSMPRPAVGAPKSSTAGKGESGSTSFSFFSDPYFAAPSAGSSLSTATSDRSCGEKVRMFGKSQSGKRQKYWGAGYEIDFPQSASYQPSQFSELLEEFSISSQNIGIQPSDDASFNDVDVHKTYISELGNRHLWTDSKEILLHGNSIKVAPYILN